MAKIELPILQLKQNSNNIEEEQVICAFPFLVDKYYLTHILNEIFSEMNFSVHPGELEMWNSLY